MTAPASPPIETSTSLPVSSLTGPNVPASVRENKPGARQAYSTAQSFEELLLNQLSQSLTQNAGLTGEGEGESETGEGGSTGEGEGGTVASLLSQALTEGVMHAGGLGLAGQLMNAVDPQLGAESGATPQPVSAGGGAVYSPAGSLAATGGASA